MGWWDSVKDYAGKGEKWGEGAASGFYEDFWGKPARDQKKALEDAGQQQLGYGQEARDWYSGQNRDIQDNIYGQAQSDLNAFRNAYGGTGGPGGSGYPGGGGNGTGMGPGGGGGPHLGRLDAEYAGADANKPTEAQDFYKKLQADGGPQEQQDYYRYLNGNRDALTNTETLYNERKDGSDPAARYQDTRAVEDINRQLAARGGFANTAGFRQIDDYYANANAQRSQQLAALAAGADTSRLGKNNQLGQAATGASGEQDTYTGRLGQAATGASHEQSDFNTYKSGLAKDADQEVADYFKTLTGNSTGLAKAEADTQTELAKAGGQALSTAQLAAIQAELAAAGVDPAKQKDFLNFITSTVGSVAKVAAA